MCRLEDILSKSIFERADVLYLLQLHGDEQLRLFNKAAQVKKNTVGNVVFFRGLIEFSNICAKNCFYCGIRKGNNAFERYNLSDETIIEAAKFAHKNDFASLVLQSGELTSAAFTNRLTRLLEKIHKATHGDLKITLSMGEQSKEVFQQWNNAGAHRYLLRLESSNSELYKKIHPNDDLHRFEKRVKALDDLRETGYQVGTGVMIGLPFQTLDDLAGDLLFMRDFGIDMVGMGPYIEHSDTPLYKYRDLLLPIEERFHLSLKMIAILRLLMPQINIAAATALQAIDKLGREKALKAGANVIMPNITPGNYRDNYLLYQNKPSADNSDEDGKSCLEVNIALTGNTIGYGEWGDSLYFKNRVKNKY
jgi:biotin synthase